MDFPGGKMSETFADNEMFLYDDDVGMNGFRETFRSKPATSSTQGFHRDQCSGPYIDKCTALFVSLNRSTLFPPS